MKRMVIISLLLSSYGLYGMQSTPKTEKSYFEQLPGDLKRLILASIVDPADATVRNIQALATTNTFFHDFINREDILKFIMVTMAEKIPDFDERDAAEKLQNMPGIKNPQLQEWLSKRKLEIPKEQDLVRAATSDDNATVARLLQEGVNVNAKDRKEKLTALALAAKSNYKEIVKKLVDAGADINSPSGIPEKSLAISAFNPLFVAAQQNAKESLAILLNAGASPNISSSKFLVTPLITAAQNNNADIVKALLAAKAHINIQDIFGYTALMKAAYKGYKEIVEMLLDAGSKIDLQDNDGTTALIWAVYNNHKDIVEKLLKAGTNLQLKSSVYGTALDLARKKGNTDIEKLLLEYGAQER